MHLCWHTNRHKRPKHSVHSDASASVWTVLIQTLLLTQGTVRTLDNTYRHKTTQDFCTQYNILIWMDPPDSNIAAHSQNFEYSSHTEHSEHSPTLTHTRRPKHYVPSLLFASVWALLIQTLLLSHRNLRTLVNTYRHKTTQAFCIYWSIRIFSSFRHCFSHKKLSEHS